MEIKTESTSRHPRPVTLPTPPAAANPAAEAEAPFEVSESYLGSMDLDGGLEMPMKVENGPISEAIPSKKSRKKSRADVQKMDFNEFREHRKQGNRKNQQTFRIRKTRGGDHADYKAKDNERKRLATQKKNAELQNLQRTVEERDDQIEKLKLELNVAKMAGEEYCRRAIREKRKMKGLEPLTDSDEEKCEGQKTFHTGFEKLKDYLGQCKFDFYDDGDDPRAKAPTPPIGRIKSDHPQAIWSARDRAFERRAEKYVAQLERQMKRKDVEIERLRADVAKKDTEMENLERMLRLKQRRETTAVAHQVAGNSTSNTPNRYENAI